MCELTKGEASDWYPYISSLPQKYSIPVYFCQHLLDSLPRPIKTAAILQCNSVKNSFNKFEKLFSELQDIFPVFKDCLNYEHFKWAWSTVNTRCIFMKCLEDCPSDQCTYHLALAPFLDLLNHSVDVQVMLYFSCISTYAADSFKSAQLVMRSCGFLVIVVNIFLNSYLNVVRQSKL